MVKAEPNILLAAVAGACAGAGIMTAFTWYFHGRSRRYDNDDDEMPFQATSGTASVHHRRLEQILKFIQETDRLKLIDRTVYVTGGKKKENSAEHSWHLAVMYMALRKDLGFAVSDSDRLRMLEMLLVHDLVEIYAGDTPLLENVTQNEDTGLWEEDDSKWAHKQLEEAAAAKRLFDLLPTDMARDFHQLWLEFEACRTPLAKVAKGLDKLHCLVQNSCCDGMDYKAYNSTYEKEVSLIQKYVDFDPTLRKLADMLLTDAKKQGWI
jgi:putative hydrolases of HD superfamily